MEKEMGDSELKEAELFPGNRKLDHDPPPMSRDQIKSVVKSVEMLLAEAEQIRNRCKQQNADSRVMMEELRQENYEMVQRYQQAEHEMEEVKKALGELMEAKASFDAHQRQLREAVEQAL